VLSIQFTTKGEDRHVVRGTRTGQQTRHEVITPKKDTLVGA